MGLYCKSVYWRGKFTACAETLKSSSKHALETKDLISPYFKLKKLLPKIYKRAYLLIRETYYVIIKNTEYHTGRHYHDVSHKKYRNCIFSL